MSREPPVLNGPKQVSDVGSLEGQQTPELKKERKIAYMYFFEFSDVFRLLVWFVRWNL